MPPYHYSDINRPPWKLPRRALLTGFATLSASALIGGDRANNPQQSRGFEGEPPEAVIKDSGTRDGTS
jgi:hypothetical protein